MARVIIDRASATIAGAVVTLTPDADMNHRPAHLAASTVVFNCVANPPASEFWEPSATKKAYYRITIERVG
jgi:hypothetical protein